MILLLALAALAHPATPAEVQAFCERDLSAWSPRATSGAVVRRDPDDLSTFLVAASRAGQVAVCRCARDLPAESWPEAVRLTAAKAGSP